MANKIKNELKKCFILTIIYKINNQSTAWLSIYIFISSAHLVLAIYQIIYAVVLSALKKSITC